MKWNTPRFGDEKIVTKFLWLPVWVNHEYRWLETATIRYDYVCFGNHYYWRPIEFLDKEKE